MTIRTTCVALFATFVLAGPVAAAAPAPRPEDFTRLPNISPPQLAPDGQAMAWVEDNRVIVYTLADQSEKVLLGGDNHMAAVEWINNDYLAVYLWPVEVPDGNEVRDVPYSPLIVTRQAKYVRQLFERPGRRTTDADIRPIIRYIDAPQPYAIALGGGNVERIDVATGKHFPGPALMDGSRFFFDVAGQERLAIEYEDGKISYGITSAVLHYRKTPGAAPETLKLPKRDDIYYIAFNYADFDNSAYWSEFNYATGVASIFRLDLMTGERTLFRSGPHKDMGIALDRFGKVTGVTTVEDRAKTEWTEPYHLKLIAAVEKLFPDATVDIADMTRDGKSVVLSLSAPEAPDSYYYYSTASQALVQIGVVYPELDGQPLAAMSYVTYKARDGLEIPAYITKRKDTPAGAPLIVLPHGGPAARDVYGFHYEAQYFASRGYVVLQPQYRGSAGFGDAFERAGNRHTLQMTTDLEDGVRYMAALGLIDPAKVCVVGASWGGYLAQAALALTPDTYACGVSKAGVADLFESLSEDNDVSWGGYGIEYWRGVIGRPGRDSDLIHAASPIDHVDAIKAPLLLIHGTLDHTVDTRQSERMNAAMVRAGKAVTYLPVKYMHHSPNNPEQRLLVLKAEDDFVAAAFAKVAATAKK